MIRALEIAEGAGGAAGLDVDDFRALELTLRRSADFWRWINPRIGSVGRKGGRSKGGAALKPGIRRQSAPKFYGFLHNSHQYEWAYSNRYSLGLIVGPYRDQSAPMNKLLEDLLLYAGALIVPALIAMGIAAWRVNRSREVPEYYPRRARRRVHPGQGREGKR
jgi:hypothetical protein